MPATSTAGQARERLRQRERAGGRRLTRAVQADVQLDEQRRAGAATLQRRREALGRQAAVDGDRQLHALGGDAREALPLVGAEGRVVHEDARRARLLEDLGLAGLRDRQAARAERELHAGRSRGTCASSCAARARSRARRSTTADRRRLASSRSRSTIATGVSTSPTGAPHLRRQQLERAIGSGAHRE